MDFVDALIQAKRVLKLNDSQIAREVGVSRQWINRVIKREVTAPKKTKRSVTYVLCIKIEQEITRHAEEVSLLERIRNDLLG